MKEQEKFIAFLKNMWESYADGESLASMLYYDLIERDADIAATASETLSNGFSRIKKNVYCSD